MKIDRVIDGIVAHGRGPIRDTFGLRSCIPATKVVIEVLRRYGHRALPLPVEVFIMSGPFADYVKAGGRWPQSAADWDALGPLMYAMVCGGNPANYTRRGAACGPSSPSMWDGHLVAWAPGGGLGWMVDASLDQASRPAAGVVLPGVFALQVSAQFRKGGDGRKLSVRQGDGGPVLQYTARPDNTEGYRTSVLWRECDDVVGQVAAEVINRMQGRPAGNLAGRRNRALGALITGAR